ncbi:hypothetical protein BDN72DRAFT_843917 [Pluteus cervinus]|uniref:Uncharacterized protein n=1 Tax=Pluteus cervinus TaxID=181527 RepID=A0ACD3AMG0_9AGAR|nr:hypothetical protein BDN72DRAFT_843917 [Pluteus cervinus]
MKASYALRETTGTILGPMPPLEFLNTFLPAPTQGRGRQDPPRDPSAFKEFSSTRKPQARYQKWIDALEPFCGRTLIQVDTHKLPVFRERKKEFGPQVCVYLGRRDRGFDPPNFLDMRHVEMSIHFSEELDPFNDEWSRSKPFERKGVKAQALLGEIAVSASTQLSFQSRTHVFSMLVFPQSVRFLRWDRAGVIVTRKISLAHSGHLVATFFQRLQFASPCTRGIDQTITTPSLSTEKEALIRQTLEVKTDTPLLQVKISGRRFVFANSAFFNSHFARSTRCFRAYNLDAKKGEGRRVILKDTWRMVGRKNEFERNEKLRWAGVSNIPRVWCGEDVLRDLRAGGSLYHRTRTQGYEYAPWTTPSKMILHTYRHYRQVMEELEGPLTSCRNMKDVVTALRDACQAQADGYKKANIVHSDSSLSNVMIKYEGDQVRGYLIDWDLSLDLDDDPQPIGPVGQWPFMAARIQIFDFWTRKYRQDQVDDVESLFHDLVYVLVYYTDFDRYLMGKYFNEMEIQGGVQCGGKTKISLMKLEGKFLCSRIECDQIRNLVKTLATVLYSRYAVHDSGISRTLGLEARRNSKLLYSDPYWMSKVLTEALKQPGWGEDELLRGNDPDDIDAEEALDWEEVAREMKERSEGRGRKKRKLR